MQGFLDSLPNVSREGKNRIVLGSEDGAAVVRLDWNGESRNWLMTAYYKKESPLGDDSRPRGLQPSAEQIPTEAISDESLGLKSRKVKQIDTPEFKRWFGDSKVVDENGEPLVVYHGTDADFEAFDIDRARKGLMGKGFYFTDSEEAARRFGKNVIPVYLKIENPYLRGTGQDKPDDLDGQIGMGGPGIPIGSKQYVVTDPTQIKSVYNRGTFDPNDPRITYSIGLPLEVASRIERAAATKPLELEAVQVAKKDLIEHVTKELDGGIINKDTARLVVGSVKGVKHLNRFANEPMRWKRKGVIP